VTPKQQAADEIHEDQILDFLVNTLTGAFSLSLGENAEIDPDDILEVLVGARADEDLYFLALREQRRRSLWH
jgi:hypothetical protein